MSICVYGRIEKKCINEDLLKGLLKEFFLIKSNIIIKKDGNSINYKSIKNNNEEIVSFISEKKPPYNVYDSSIIESEYEYIQLIIFDIKKEDATIDKYKLIINFFIWLKEKIDSNILVTSDVHNDICLLLKNEIIWSKTLPFDYS